MLEVRNLTIQTGSGATLLNNLSLSLEKGQATGLTGQSGAGKTTLMKAILGLLGSDQHIVGGAVLAEGKDLAGFSPRQRRDLCGTTIGFIPQSPITAFDRRQTIGRQMEETLRLRLKLSKEDSGKLAMEKINAVNLPDAGRVWSSRPWQLSGGMLQRVVVALLLALKPRYILADEPTSALDEENRDILLSLLKHQLSHAGLLLITHDAQALRILCGQVLVLNEGSMIERQDTAELFAAPRQPWTKEFVRCSTTLDQEEFLWKEL